MAATIAVPAPSFGWLRGAAFDLPFVAGTTVLALLSGGLVVFDPRLFPVILAVDLWLLGYHHVVSTFTRLAFDRESLREHTFLVTWLPLLVLLAVVGACLATGPWILTTSYLYWQWWHYTRQSYGVSRIYQRKAGVGDDLLAKLVMYAVPTCGILFRSYQEPAKFLFAEVKVLPVPFLLLTLSVAFAAGVTALWVMRQVAAWRAGTLSPAYTLYVSSHLLIFTVGYLLIRDINHGWLVLNVWHNAQYILIVWMFNNNRFKAGVEARARFLSTISQRRNVGRYFLACLAISTAFYVALALTLNWVAAATAAALPLVVVAYQVINFHHYIVDSIIWKVRKKSLRQNLGVAT
jgi:hypothetical protein